MKTQTLSELLVAGALGCLSGLGRIGAHLKWQRLGLGAYLERQTLTYRHLYAQPVFALREIVLFVMFTLLAYTVFKTLSTGLAYLLSLGRRKQEAEPPAELAG